MGIHYQHGPMYKSSLQVFFLFIKLFEIEVFCCEGPINRSLYSSKQLLDRFFTKQHEWIDVNGEIGTVGVTDYAQSALGDVVYAQLPSPDQAFEQMEECAALESVKAASE